MGRGGGFGLFVGFLFGLYLFAVKGMGLVTLPKFIAGIDKWLLLLSALFLVIGGFYFRKSMKYSASSFINRIGTLGMLVYFVFALYFVAGALKFFSSIISSLSGISRWIYLLGGILLAIGGIYFYKEKRY